MNKIIVDLASYQSDTPAFMKKLYAAGVRGLMVKLTEGTNYLNPKAGTQVCNGFKTFKTVGLYHYFRGNGKAEATYFLKWVKAFRMDKTTPLAVDVEDHALTGNITAQVNIFLNELKKAGYRCRVVYSFASWFKDGHIDIARLVDKNLWVASFNSKKPGVNNAGAWQFTDNYKCMQVDASVDFFGILTGEKYTKPVLDPENYWKSGKLFETKTKLNVYKSLHLVKKNRTGEFFTSGSRIKGVAVKNGSIHSIKTKNGYISGNKDKIAKI